MSRFGLSLVATLMLTATLAADTSRIYRVTLAGASASDARDIVHLYGGRIVAVASQGGELTLRISADGAKSLSRDPRVVRLTSSDSIANGSIAVDDAPDIVLGPYLYDGAGDIRTIGSEQFLYDRNTRLVSAATVPGKQTFNYDAFGNRTTATTTGIVKCNDGADCALNPDVNRNTNHLSGPQTVYDNAGNLAQIDGHAYTYDPLGMMTSQNAAQFSQYVYTADDERIAVYKGTRWEWSVRDASARVLRAFTSDDTATAPASNNWTWITDNVFRGSLLLAAEHPESGRRHFHVDHLGTPRLITYDGGSIAGSYEYYVFGTQPDAGNREIPLEELKFTGHQRDLAGGDVHVLDYMHARYYDGAVGRFVSIDRHLANLLRPQSWNRYAYVLNSPMNFIDPDGLAERSPGEQVTDHDTCDGTVVDGWCTGDTITVEAKADPVKEIDWYSALESAANVTAGFADTITFGVTRQIRQVRGTDQVINPCSGAYLGGEIGGIAWSFAAGGEIANAAYGVDSAAAELGNITVRTSEFDSTLAGLNATEKLAALGGKASAALRAVRNVVNPAMWPTYAKTTAMTGPTLGGGVGLLTGSVTTANAVHSTTRNCF